MVTVPPETPETIPDDETVAILVLDETQGLVVAAVPEPVSCTVLDTQTILVPTIEH
jgi:hypothetical protein